MGIFTLEALDAAEGDALLLHYGDSTDPRLAVIDGGPKGVFAAALGPRMREIHAKRKKAGTLQDGLVEIRLLVTTHVDEDHIYGVQELVDELCTPGKAQLCDVLTFWHNSFGDAVADPAADDAPLTAVAAGKVSGASVKQGRTLRAKAQQLSWFLNRPFKSLVCADDAHASWDAGSELNLTVVGPNRAALDELRTAWGKEVKKILAKDPSLHVAAASAEAATCCDEKIYNVVSIAVLATFQKKYTMLLLGDARSDHVYRGLQEAGRLSGGRLHVDVLKLPHHGSKNNVDRAFLENVTADHYVISAKKKHGHPDVETLEALVAARGAARYTVHLTNPVPHALAYLAEAQHGRAFEVVVRDPKSPGLRIELADPLPL